MSYSLMIPLCLRLFKKLESLFLNCTRYTTGYSSQRYVFLSLMFSYLITEISSLRIVLIVGLYWNKVHIWDSFSNYFPFGGCGGSEKNHVPKDTSLEWLFQVSSTPQCICSSSCIITSAFLLQYMWYVL